MRPSGDGMRSFILYFDAATKISDVTSHPIKHKTKQINSINLNNSGNETHNDIKFIFYLYHSTCQHVLEILLSQSEQ